MNSSVQIKISVFGWQVHQMQPHFWSNFTFKSFNSVIGKQTSSVLNIFVYYKSVLFTEVKMASNWRLILHPCNRELYQRQSITLRIGETRIGRSALNTVRIEGTNRFHCSIFLSRHKVLLVDYSTRGTVVNNNIILNATIELKEEDIIQIENVAFILMKDMIREIIELE